MKKPLLSLLCLASGALWGQSEPGFDWRLQLMGCMSQIDGDAAVGYSKPGFSLGFAGSYGLPIRRLDYQISFSELGSLRPFDADNPGLTPFHIHVRQLEVGLYQSRSFAQWGYPQTRWALGLTATRLLRAWESQGYMPRLQDDYRNMGAMGSLRLTHGLRERLSLVASADYSLWSIVNNSATRWVGWGLARGGAYHNRIQVGLLLRP
ncbi:MAG: hypothetical protein ACO3GK_06710 [Bacteroidia bacterium]